MKRIIFIVVLLLTAAMVFTACESATALKQATED